MLAPPAGSGTEHRKQTILVHFGAFSELLRQGQLPDFFLFGCVSVIVPFRFRSVTVTVFFIRFFEFGLPVNTVPNKINYLKTKTMNDPK